MRITAFSGDSILLSPLHLHIRPLGQKKKAAPKDCPYTFKMVTPAGFEPATPRLGIWCSILLSYGATKSRVLINVERAGRQAQSPARSSTLYTRKRLGRQCTPPLSLLLALFAPVFIAKVFEKGGGVGEGKTFAKVFPSPTCLLPLSPSPSSPYTTPSRSMVR